MRGGSGGGWNDCSDRPEWPSVPLDRRGRFAEQVRFHSEWRRANRLVHNISLQTQNGVKVHTSIGNPERG